MSKIILGNRNDDYYIQLFGDGKPNNKIDPWGTCSNSAMSTALSTAGYDLKKIPGKKDYSADDRLTEIVIDKTRWPEYAAHLIEKRPNNKTNWLNYFNTTPPYRVPEILAYIVNQIFGVFAAHFGYTGVDFISIKKEIDKGNPCIVLADITPQLHYVPIVGYEAARETAKIFINDPAPNLYKSQDGYNQPYDYLSPKSNVLANNFDLKDNRENITLQTWKIIIKKA